MDYKLYTIPDDIFKYYIEDTKRGKNCTKECVERKILAMMLSAPKCVDNGIGCKKYQFGTFNIFVREETNTIRMVYWSKKSVFISQENSKHMKNLYELLGLSEDGQSIKKDINDEKLISYIKENNLSNLNETWDDYFKTDPDVLDFTKTIVE